MLELRELFFRGGTAFDQTTCQTYTFLFQHYSSQGKGVCFSGCEFIKLYFRNVKMVDFGD